LSETILPLAFRGTLEKPTELSIRASPWDTVSLPQGAVPDLPISQMSLACPYCKAKPNSDCCTSAGTFSVVHVARIRAAAVKARKRKSGSAKIAAEPPIEQR